ncbi:hypothetical protein [Amycolatopsis sp. RTGN1]|uniref:hypothetical protein n=1 Tax=Amycolatopsis ponsaeliensis TaxID=2992142 RepID=UPI00254C94EE|nr:hypothetical protein [Amycolatopsis sp. RTGN1]
MPQRRHGCPGIRGGDREDLVEAQRQEFRARAAQPAAEHHGQAGQRGIGPHAVEDVHPRSAVHRGQHQAVRPLAAASTGRVSRHAHGVAFAFEHHLQRDQAPRGRIQPG